jgi:hypothetical protein
MVCPQLPPIRGARTTDTITVFPAAVHQWSTKQPESYPGSGTTWYDIVGTLDLQEHSVGTMPTYNASTKDFTFLNSALKSAPLTESNSPLLTNIHKGDRDFTIIMRANLDDNAATTKVIMGTRGSSGCGIQLSQSASSSDLFCSVLVDGSWGGSEAITEQLSTYETLVMSYDSTNDILYFGYAEDSPTVFTDYLGGSNADTLDNNEPFYVGLLLPTNDRHISGEISDIIVTNTYYTDFSSINAFFA